jgi:hypothetical protein
VLLDDHPEDRHVGILLPCHENSTSPTRSLRDHTHALLSLLSDLSGQNFKSRLTRYCIVYDSEDDVYDIVEEVD